MQDVIFSYANMRSMASSADSVARGNKVNPIVGAVGSFLGGEAATLMCAVALGVEFSTAGLGILSSIASAIVDTMDQNAKINYYNLYSEICDVMADGGFTAVKLSGYFNPMSKTINGTTYHYYQISGYPNVIGYKTKSGVWSTVN